MQEYNDNNSYTDWDNKFEKIDADSLDNLDEEDDKKYDYFESKIS